MVKIGILGGRLGETNPSDTYRKWMDNVPDKYIDDEGGIWGLHEFLEVKTITHWPK